MVSTVIPCLAYDDAPAMIDWLCRVFAFEKHLVVEDDDGSIAHAELMMGGGMVMVGSAHSNRASLSTPKALGGVTQTPYLVVADADEVFARAKAEGAEIVMEVADQPHGGRAFACRDPEGHLWHVGTYDPWVG